MGDMTIPEAAAALGMSLDGVRRRIRRGEMKAHRMGARLWVISADEVERWQRLGKQKPGPKPRQQNPES